MLDVYLRGASLWAIYFTFWTFFFEGGMEFCLETGFVVKDLQYAIVST